MKYRNSLICFTSSSSLHLRSPLFSIFLQYSSGNTLLSIYRVSQTTLIFHTPLGAGGLSPPLFLAICKSVRTMQRYKKISIIPNFRGTFLDEALAFAYCIDARMRDFTDVAEADALTQ